MNGCEGGPIPNLSEFVCEFGSELNENYPCRANEDVCPYKTEQMATNRDIAGFIRVNEPTTFNAVPLNMIFMFLEDRPMVVYVEANYQFLEYGGGVDGSGANVGQNTYIRSLE